MKEEIKKKKISAVEKTWMKRQTKDMIDVS